MACNCREYYRLTHPQKRIWYIDKINMDSPLHNIGGCLEINDSIDVDKMKQTLNLIIKNNEGLRLRITEKNGEPVQYVSEYKKENIDFIDFSKYLRPEEECIRWSQKLFEKRFELIDKQLYYFAIYKIDENKYGILLIIHHIIADGWSISLMQRQICEIYRRLIIKEEICIYKCHSYLDYIKEEEEYLNSEKFIRNRNFWKHKFSDVTEEFLYKSIYSLEGKRQSFNIDEELSNKINKFIYVKNCYLNTFFIVIMLVFLNKTTYKNDLVIGTPVYNRTSKVQKNMLGMFTNTVPFRFKLDTELKIEDLIKLANKELKLCFLNQRYPYDLMIKDLEIDKEGYDSLFKMCVNYYNSKYDNDMNGIDVKVKEYYCGNQSYSMQLTIKEWEKGNIILSFDYKVMEYLEQGIHAMYQSIINIIKQVLMNDNIKVKDISLVSEEEVKYKIYEINSTSTYYPSKTVNELFEEQAMYTPNKIALEFKHETLTYRELNIKSNQLANYLRHMSISKESVVGIMANHSLELVIGILAVLKAGATYLPIDPSYPIERINYMLKDSKSVMLLTNFEVSEEIKFKGSIVNINHIDYKLYSKEDLIKMNGLNDLAYIIYTSGSTGKPKGVMIEHKSLTNYIWWAKKMYFKDESEVMALYSSISHDLTVTSIFTPLISGNKIVIYDNDETEFVLYKILRENKVTVLKLTPAHLTLIKDRDNRNSNIKRFIVGGEDLKVSLAKKVYDSFGKNIEIFNEYGPTETTVGCMIHKYDEEKDKGVSVPIGYPADNVQIYILDDELKPVLTGFVGELYVSGDGVSRGYLNRVELTYERFIENPFIEGKRMYKTGDTARYIDNGIIEYTGRTDNQVKIRGHRIELGEIEKHLTENELVKDAVVTFKEDTSGNKFLNAYIVRKKEIEEKELKDWLLKFLPRYMIPTNFMFIDSLPLTLNGKVNYSLLPESIVGNKQFVSFNTSFERELVKAMEEVLGVENISMNDNYYQLGGDSIKAIQISSKLKNVGLNIKVKDILAYDSIKEIAAMIEKDKETIKIDQEQCHGEIENTPIVEWFFNEKFENEDLYNQYVVLEYKGVLDINKVTIAVNKLINHHDALRINYDRKSNKLYYNDKHLNGIDSVKYIDLQEFTYDEQCKSVKNLIKKANVSFNIDNSLLFNVTMFYLGGEKYALLFTAHHLIVDGVSWRIILDDFLTILGQLNSNDQIKLSMKTHSFKEWSEALQQYSKKDFSEERDYWQSILDKDFNYPIDFRSEKDVVKTSKVLIRELNTITLNELIKKTSEIYNIELNEVLIIALVVTISELTNKNEVIIELEEHGRQAINDYIDITRTVGWFTSMYPAYFNIEYKEIDKNIKSIKEQLRNIPNNGFNYGIIKFLNHELKEFDRKYVRFNYLGDFDNIIDKEKLDVYSIEFGLSSDERNSMTALIDVEAMIINRKLKICITYSNNRFKDETIQVFINNYMDKLQLILDHCISKSFKEFTPSDFDTIDILQEDLDSLFN